MGISTRFSTLVNSHAVEAMKAEKLIPVLVEEIPAHDDIQPGHLYISHKYGTAMHLCACGCGEEVVTPLSPQGWTLHFNGRFSLTPSIGNFEFPCHSHYFVTDEKICWCRNNYDDTPYESRNTKKKRKGKKKKSAKIVFFQKLFQFFG